MGIGPSKTKRQSDCTLSASSRLCLDRWLEELDKYDNTGLEVGMGKMVEVTKSDQVEGDK